LKLSILICSLHERKESLERLIELLKEQHPGRWGDNLETYKVYSLRRLVCKGVEIIVCTDSGEMIVGEKRNLLKKYANGEYLCYFDDDDTPSEDYLAEILKAIEKKPDVVCFNAHQYENGEKMFFVNFGKHTTDKNDNKKMIAYRMANHLCVWKRDLAKRTDFPRISFGEDGAWARKMRRYIRTIVKIEKVLYHYWFSHEGTRTQQHRFED